MEGRHISFDMSDSSVAVTRNADIDENLEKRNQRRNKLFRRIQMDIKVIRRGGNVNKIFSIK